MRWLLSEEEGDVGGAERSHARASEFLRDPIGEELQEALVGHARIVLVDQDRVPKSERLLQFSPEDVSRRAPAAPGTARDLDAVVWIDEHQRTAGKPHPGAGEVLETSRRPFRQYGLEVLSVRDKTPFAGVGHAAGDTWVEQAGKRVKQARVVATPLGRLLQVGTELAVASAIVWCEQPANADSQAGYLRQSA